MDTRNGSWNPVEEPPEEGEFVMVSFGDDELSVGIWFFEEGGDPDEHDTYREYYVQWQCWDFGADKFLSCNPPKKWRTIPRSNK